MDNMDNIVEMCRQAVSDIIQTVGGVGNLLVDENRMALIQAIATRIDQLGADVTAVLGTELAKAYYKGITDADAFLKGDGMDISVTGMNKQIHLAGIESIVADTMQDMNASFRTALQMGIADIDDILANVNADISKGMILGDPTDRIASAVMQSFAKSGMTSFITKDGKRLPLDFYAQTVTRTKYRVAHTTGAINRYQESGVYHVKIDEHHPTCHVCAKYQGMVVALDADHAEGFPTNIPLPPYHPNCQHVARPFVMDFHSKADIQKEKKKWNQFDPDADKRTDAQKELYKTEQSIRRRARAEMKQYMIMKAHLGDDAPKTLGAFRRMKRKNDEKWQSLQKQYKASADIVTRQGPSDPGTPRKRKGTGSGVSGAPIPKPKKKTPAPSKEKPVDKKDKVVDKKDTSTMSMSHLNLKPEDHKAHAEFDRIIDGIEFADRKKTSKFLIDKVDGTQDIKVSIKSNINANGYCAISRSPQGKMQITQFVLEKNDLRPDIQKYKTMFHEFYHLNANGTKYPGMGLGELWVMWEETATECSAFFMSQRAGIDTSSIVPSYAKHIVNTLPRLKQMDEFKDCETLADFGAKFMKYRFDPDHKTADWMNMARDALQQKVNTDMDDYFRTHYLEYTKQNVDRFEDMIFETLPQMNKFEAETGIRAMIRKGLDAGIASGKMNREIQMIMPVLFNELGVKV